MRLSSNYLLLILFLFNFSFTILAGTNIGVRYDGRSLIINGKRELLFSGSIHYPRSTPDMWPQLISKAKHGGLNVIQTYVFWNIHEPEEGKFNFNGRYDLVKFIKIIQEHGMFVTLRIGPFIQAEWNFGGLPFWLREVKNMTFRTNNPPFKYYMEKYAKKVMDMMRKERLFAPQGGPIILAQIENEYNMIQPAFRDDGYRYVQWAGKMALGLHIGVPWIMCKQKDAPDPVINTCNGRNCGETFTGPNSPNKPALWTENWTAQYRVFGDPPSQRPVEDLAFAVARFFSKNGTLTNYYMYHGGTNFGRTAADFVTTRYYDEAPLDEYGFQKEPKWGHLKDLHSALKLCKKPLLWGASSKVSLGQGLEARVYERLRTKSCAAFLTNNDPRIPATVKFRGLEYHLPPRSISILPDCKTVIFNTKRVNSQHNSRTYHLSEEASKNANWEKYQEKVPTVADTTIRLRGPVDHLNLTRDTTDYLWYTVSIDLQSDALPRRRDISPVIQVASLGHVLHTFVNGEFIGTQHGNNIEKSFTFQKTVKLKTGTNHISILSMTMGLPDSGPYLERRLTGVHSVRIQGLNIGTLDLSFSHWGYQVGFEGEKLKIFSEPGSKNVPWSSAKGHVNKPLTWYKKYFDAPQPFGDEPVVVDLSSMGKGRAWVNGWGIGRYWVSYLSPLGEPTQSVYHIPRAFLKPKDNLLVIYEETGGNPYEIKVLTARRDTICTFVSEFHPPHVGSWVSMNNTIQAIEDDINPVANLKCPKNKVINTIQFASFGNPLGVCGNFTTGSCHVPQTKEMMEKACLGKNSCFIRVSEAVFKAKQCKETTKTLAVQALCKYNSPVPGITHKW